MLKIAFRVAFVVAAMLSTSPFSAAATPQFSAAAACRFEGEPRLWTAQALQAWDRLDRQRLHIAKPVTPVVALFDQNCVYHLIPDPRGDFRVGARRYATNGEPHGGQIVLPDGSSVPVGRIAFATPISDGRMFFTMALPPLWRANAGKQRDPTRLAMVVFMHEFTHTQQADGLGSRIDGLLERGLPANADDDVVQDHFADRPGYRAAYEAERDAFYGAAQASDLAGVRAGLAVARTRMAARRARWFTGDDAVYAQADDIFLTLEGSGNWSAWAWLTDPAGGRMSSTDAVAFIRGAGTHWSQDEGLAAMLAIDRLTPDWPALAFGHRASTLDGLMRRALEAP